MLLFHRKKDIALSKTSLTDRTKWSSGTKELNISTTDYICSSRDRMDFGVPGIEKTEYP